jgi:hypothetical protein
MIRNLVTRSVEVLVLLFAAWTFFFVQVGRHTPYGHVVAIFTTRPAKEAAADFSKAGSQMKAKVLDEKTASGRDGKR